MVAMSLWMDISEWNWSHNDHYWCSAMISEIKVTIALLFQSSLTMLAVQWWQRNQSKNVVRVQSFCFAYFIVALSLLVALPCKKIFDMQQFACKTDNKMDVGSYPCRGPLIQKQHCDYSTGCGNVSNCQWQSYSWLY